MSTRASAPLTAGPTISDRGMAPAKPHKRCDNAMSPSARNIALTVEGAARTSCQNRSLPTLRR